MRIGKERPPSRDHRLYGGVTARVIISGLIAAGCFAATATAKQVTTGTPKAATAQKPKRPVRPSPVEIEGARAKLAELGYWVSREARGADASLIHALVAFQKIEGRKPTGVLNKVEIEAISAGQPPTPLETGYTHIEVNLAKQVLLFVEPPGESLRVLPISSGSGEYYQDEGVTRLAETPTGRFKVQRKIDGWRKSRLGLLYYPNYILGGIAIHGNPAVPTFPASHGCIRIPMFAAKEFSEMAFVGIPVLVHNGTGTEGSAPPGNAEVQPRLRSSRSWQANLPRNDGALRFQTLWATIGRKARADYVEGRPSHFEDSAPVDALVPRDQRRDILGDAGISPARQASGANARRR